MSSSLNSSIADLSRAPADCDHAAPAATVCPRRRALLLAFGSALLAAVTSTLPLPARASSGIPTLEALRPWGRGEYRKWGFLVYEASLWAGDDPLRPPLALRLDYQRKIDGKAIAAASIGEMRRFIGNEALLREWGEHMEKIFPDVSPGDHIIGVYEPDAARFYQRNRLIGEIRSAEFARAFFGIWLDPRTSAPELRAALIKQG